MVDVADIPYNWRKAQMGADFPAPTLRNLESCSLLPTSSCVFLPAGSWDNVIAIRDWIADNTGEKGPCLYGRFGWKVMAFKTKRTFLGLTFKFTDISDLIYFKLRWQQPT